MPPKRGRAPPDDGVSDLLFGFDDGADDDSAASDGDASGDSRGAAPLHPPRARRRAAPSSQPAPPAINIDAILDAGDDAATVSSTSTRSDSWDEPGREAAAAAVAAAPARAADARATALEQALAAADRAAAAASASPSSSSSSSEDEEGEGGGAAAAPITLSDDDAGPTTVALAFRTRRGGQLTVALAVDAPLSRAFAAFEAKARAQGWIQQGGAPPRYVFDGQALDGGATPGALDMEDDDVIDVWE